MNSTDSKLDRDNKALEALIAASLHQDQNPVEPPVVAKYMKGDFVLTPQEEEALRKYSRSLLLSGEAQTTDSLPAANTQCDAVMALHRNKPKGGFSTQTEEELDRKRRELRERLRQNREKKGP